jgi:hypothetical protein
MQHISGLLSSLVIGDFRTRGDLVLVDLVLPPRLITL